MDREITDITHNDEGVFTARLDSGEFISGRGNRTQDDSWGESGTIRGSLRDAPQSLLGSKVVIYYHGDHGTMEVSN